MILVIRYSVDFNYMYYVQRDANDNKKIFFVLKSLKIP